MQYPLITISFILVMMTSCQAQKNTLKTHQWQNRLLMVIASDTTNASYQKQITHLTKNKKDLIERKLLIYKVFPNKHMKGLENNEMVSSKDLYTKYNSKSQSFKVVLIGLDGGIKLKQSAIISIEKLNGIIDAMPMRINELRRNE